MNRAFEQWLIEYSKTHIIDDLITLKLIYFEETQKRFAEYDAKEAYKHGNVIGCGSYYGGHKNRLFDGKGAVKVLEVAVQKSDYNYFNLHLKSVFFACK